MELFRPMKVVLPMGTQQKGLVCLRLPCTLKAGCPDIMNKPLLSTTVQEHAGSRTGKMKVGREGRRRRSKIRRHVLKGKVTVRFVVKNQKIFQSPENWVSSGEDMRYNTLVHRCII